ncbi:MAG: hypothetical protein SGPRY_005327 [Prymnesium sp.]
MAGLWLIWLAWLSLASPLELRLARPSDLEGVGTLRLLVFSPHLSSTYSTYQQAKQYCEAAARKTAVILAEEGGQLVGAADLMLDLPPMPGCPPACYLSSVCVHPSLRRSGIGKHLMSEAEKGAERLKAALIALHVEEANLPARLFYVSLGYSLSPLASPLAARFESCLPDDADAPRQVFMSKSLLADP